MRNLAGDVGEDLWEPNSHSADVINLDPAANGKSGVKSWLLFLSPNCPAK